MDIKQHWPTDRLTDWWTHDVAYWTALKKEKHERKDDLDRWLEGIWPLRLWLSLISNNGNHNANISLTLQKLKIYIYKLSLAVINLSSFGHSIGITKYVVSVNLMCLLYSSLAVWRSAKKCMHFSAVMCYAWLVVLGITPRTTSHSILFLQPVTQFYLKKKTNL